MRLIFTTAAVFLSTLLLAQSQYTFVFLHKKTDVVNTPKAVVDSLMKGHMANMERLAAEGKLLAAGPFDGGGGIFIFATRDLREAKEWLSTDPGVQAERWRVEMQPYRPRVGGICPVGEKYEMTSYSFIRFNVLVSKSNAGNYIDLLRKHDEYLKTITTTEKVVTEGIFGDHDGGIIVLDGDVSSAIFEKDPAVQDGLVTIDFKKLYIAKGSFCER